MSKECIWLMFSLKDRNIKYQLPVFVANGLRNNIAGRSWLTVMDKVNWNRLLFPKKFEANQQKKLEKDSTSSEFLTIKVDIN